MPILAKKKIIFSDDKLHQFINHGNVVQFVRKLRTDFGRREASSAPYVCYLVKKVKATGILIDKPKREKLKTVRTPREDFDF